jgi:hypothetical protein
MVELAPEAFLLGYILEVPGQAFGMSNSVGGNICFTLSERRSVFGGGGNGAALARYSAVSFVFILRQSEVCTIRRRFMHYGK